MAEEKRCSLLPPGLGLQECNASKCGSHRGTVRGEAVGEWCRPLKSRDEA